MMQVPGQVPGLYTKEVRAIMDATTPSTVSFEHLVCCTALWPCISRESSRFSFPGCIASRLQGTCVVLPPVRPRLGRPTYVEKCTRASRIGGMAAQTFCKCQHVGQCGDRKLWLLMECFAFFRFFMRGGP